MPNAKRTRDRQLAKLAARRQAERRAQRRRREIAVGAILTVVAIAVLVGGWFVFFADDEQRAAPTPTPSASPSAEPGTQTGTVTPQPAAEVVACGGSAPDAASEPKPQFAGPPPMTIDPQATYTATIRTSCGRIALELDPGAAPRTVNSFVFLAREGYFDGQYFHRLDTSIDVIQGGDPTGSGSGGPGYSIPDELAGDESYGPGVLAMANAGANTGGSQFFIVTGPDGRNLDESPDYTIFGRVVEGLDVAKRIQELPVRDPQAGLAGQQPLRAVYIETVTIAES